MKPPHLPSISALIRLALVVVLTSILFTLSIALVSAQQSSPSVEKVEISSSPHGGEAYYIREFILVAVTFTERVKVSGSPRLRFTIGDAKQWAYYSHSKMSGRQLFFGYRVKSGDSDDNGISIPANSLKLKGGSIVDYEGNAASLNHEAVPDQAGHQVDTSPNRDPWFPTATTTRRVMENTRAGENVGSHVFAWDLNNDARTYSLSAGDTDSFDIVSTSGQIRVKTGADLDYETKNSYSVTVAVTDNKDSNGGVDDSVDDTITVSIVVMDVNEAPNAVNDSATTTEDTPVRVNALANDSDPDTDATLVISEVGSPGNGKVTLGSATSSVLIYTPALDFHGQDTFTYTVSDGELTAEGTVTVTVSPVDDHVTLRGASTVIYSENGTSIVATYTASAPDSTSSVFTWSLGGADADDFNIRDGALSFKSTPDYENPTDAGTDNKYNVTARVSNGSATSTLDVIVKVLNVEEPPVAVDDVLRFEIRKPPPGNVNPGNREEYLRLRALLRVCIKVKDNDRLLETGNENAIIAAWPHERPKYGSFGVGGCNPTEIRYDFKVNFHGEDYFRYTLMDKNLKLSNPATVTLLIGPPKITGKGSVAYPENATSTVATYKAVNLDPGDITWSLSGSAAGDFNISSDGELTFRSPPVYNSTTTNANIRTVEVKASDSATSTSKVVTVTVTKAPPTPLPNPVPVDDTATTTENTPVTIDVLSNDTPGAVITSYYGSLNSDVDLTSDNKIIYTPNPGFNGTDTFHYWITTHWRGHVSAKVTVVVSGVNDPPRISGNSLVTHRVSYPENATRAVTTLTASDPDNDSLTWSLAGDDAAKFSISDGALSFRSPPDFENPADTGTNNKYDVTVKVSDSATTTSRDVAVTVTDVNEPPVAEDDVATTSLRAAVDISVLDNDSDPDKETAAFRTLRVFVSIPPRFGKAALKSDSGQVITYTPGRDFHGVDSFTYTVTDGTWQSTAKVTVLVGEPAVSGGSATSYPENSTSTVMHIGLLHVVDPNGTTTWSLIGGEDKDLFELGAYTGNQTTLHFKSPPDYEDPRDHDKDNDYVVDIKAKTIAYGIEFETQAMVMDGTTVIVTDVYEGPPDAKDDSATTTENVPVYIAVLDNDTIMDSYPLSISCYTQGSHGRVVPSTDGALTYAPDTDFSGEDTFNYCASDGFKSAQAQVRVTVTARPVEELLTLSGKKRVKYAENATGTVATYIANNAGTSTLTWSLAGADAGDFSINGGALTFKSAPDFENPADDDNDNAYQVKVRVSSGGVRSTRAVTVIVTDVNEPPKFPDTLTNVLQIIENSPKGTDISTPVAATDPDQTPKFSKLNYTLSGVDARSFKIANKSGQLKVRTTLDFEEKASYSVTVNVSDGRDASGSADDSVDDTAEVTVQVTDDPVDDAEAAREAWQKSGLTATGGHFRVLLEWDRPKDPSITRYQYRYKWDGGSYGDWTDIPNSDATTTVTHMVTDVGGGNMGAGDLRVQSQVGNLVGHRPGVQRSENLSCADAGVNSVVARRSVQHLHQREWRLRPTVLDSGIRVTA